jgi:hypothetical protein
MKDEFIFRQPKDNIRDKDPDIVELYTLMDNHDFIDETDNPRAKQDNHKVLAKKFFREDGTIKFMIKRDSSGKLFNPLSIYGDNPSRAANFLDKTCKDFKFRTVNMKIFEHYVNFLRTKNLSWLYNAEREAE